MNARLKNLLRPFYKKVVKPFLGYARWTVYMGNRVECPICRKRFRKFMLLGMKISAVESHQVIVGGRRDNVMCPFCSSLPRHRLLCLYLRHKTPLFLGSYKVFHLAPEDWLRRDLLKNARIQYLCADFHMKNVDMNVDLTGLDIPDESFDVIICCHVLEHISDDMKAIAEVFRVLRNDGWAILQVPYITSSIKSYEDPSILSEHDREFAFGQKDHVRIYALEDYVQRLSSVGFTVERFSWSDNDLECRRLGLNPQEELMICKKQNVA